MGKTNAQYIIQFCMVENIPGIIDQTETDLSQHRAKQDNSAFRYPSLSGMLGRYKPKPPRKVNANDILNRPVQTVRAENLDLEDERKQLQARLAAVLKDKAAAEEREARERQAKNQQLEENERLLDRITELERENAGLRASAQDSDYEVSLTSEEPKAERAPKAGSRTRTETRNASPELKRRIVELVVGGLSVTKACVELGINRTIAYQWRDKDQEFRDALDRQVGSRRS